MKYICLVIVALLIQPNLAYSASATCPNVSDFACLVKNSQKVYKEDYEQWWKIYYFTAKKAQSCTDFKDVSLFFRLWSGWTDGETAESLFPDTENILIDNNRCFFEGWIGLPLKDRTAFISRYCPDAEHEKIINALNKAMKIPRYKPMATQLLKRVESERCNGK